MLKSLVSTSGFDLDCIRLESEWFRRPVETKIPYFYFDARLAELDEELKNPTPRGWEISLERKNAPRHALLATLIE